MGACASSRPPSSSRHWRRLAACGTRGGTPADLAITGGHGRGGRAQQHRAARAHRGHHRSRDCGGGRFGRRLRAGAHGGRRRQLRPARLVGHARALRGRPGAHRREPEPAAPVISPTASRPSATPPATSAPACSSGARRWRLGSLLGPDHLHVGAEYSKASRRCGPATWRVGTPRLEVRAALDQLQAMKVDFVKPHREHPACPSSYLLGVRDRPARGLKTSAHVPVAVTLDQGVGGGSRLDSSTRRTRCVAARRREAELSAAVGGGGRAPAADAVTAMIDSYDERHRARHVRAPGACAARP